MEQELRSARVGAERLDDREAQLLGRLLDMIEQRGEREELLAFLVRCAACFDRSAEREPEALMRQFVGEGDDAARRRRRQLWMLFQLADSMFTDPEELRHLLHVERWARQVGVAAELREIQSRLLRGLGTVKPPSP
jgi:hypothetical protein